MIAGHGAAAGLASPAACRRSRCLAVGFLDAVGAGRRILRRRCGFCSSASLLWLVGVAAAAGHAIDRRSRPWAVSRLGFRSAAFRPSRSVLSAALIASAAFIIVSVDAFRRDGGDLTKDPKSGTGGFALFARIRAAASAESERAERARRAGRAGGGLARTRFTRFRVRPGEDVSCLNLYRPTNPTIIAPEAGLHRRAIASPSPHPWPRPMPSAPTRGSCLQRQFDDGADPRRGRRDVDAVRAASSASAIRSRWTPAESDRSCCVSSAPCRTACSRASWSSARRTSCGSFPQ